MSFKLAVGAVTDVWTDANGWKCYIDADGKAWRWDAKQGWVRYAKYDLPDKEAK